MKGEKQIKKFSYTFYSWSALIDRFLNLYKAFTPPWTSMEIRTFIMLNTDSRKSFKKLAGSSSHRTVPPLFCDFIIAYISPFFNWHFNRSFQKVFVEQGEVSATFSKRIYKKDFLWYNKNVGACLQTSPIFIKNHGRSGPPPSGSVRPAGTNKKISGTFAANVSHKNEITLDRASQHNQGLFLFTLDI